MATAMEHQTLKKGIRGVPTETLDSQGRQCRLQMVDHIFPENPRGPSSWMMMMIIIIIIHHPIYG